MEMVGQRQQPFIKTADINTALDGQALKNNQEPSFIRLWKWYLLRLNQSSLKPKAPIAIGVELSGLKGKIASALEKNEKLAPIAIGVELRSQL